MKFAVLGDVHSNIYALESVIKDMKSKNVDFILSTGDLVGYLPFPNEVVDLIRSTGILAVQGNHDKYIAFCENINKEAVDKMSQQEILANASAVYTNMTLREDNRNYLRGMPTEIRIQVNGVKVLLVHGSPRKIDEYMYEDSPELEVIADETDADIVVCGHTHIPYSRVVAGKHFINAGSAGKPKHGNANATYVIVNIVDSNIEVEINEVTYDVEKTVIALEKNCMFDKRLSEALRKGC